MAKYGPKSQEKVQEAMHELKEGKLKSGKSGKAVHSRTTGTRVDARRKQAVAIGLSQARKEGNKVPHRG